MNTRKSVKPFLITLVISMVISLAVLMARQFFTLDDYFEKMSALSDAFFVPGIVLVGFGVLVMVADEGFFDIFRYGLLKLTMTLRVQGKADEDMPKDFYEYRVARHGEKKKPQWSIFAVGAIDLLLAVLFLLLYSGGESIL